MLPSTDFACGAVVWAFGLFAKFGEHPWPAREDAILGYGVAKCDKSATVVAEQHVRCVFATDGDHENVIGLADRAVLWWLHGRDRATATPRGLAMADSDWRNIDLDTLIDEERTSWEVMKDAYKRYQDCKRVFELQFTARIVPDLPSHLELKFGYNFGKLSIAVGPKRERKQAKAETQSLGDWLAAQAASGHNS